MIETLGLNEGKEFEAVLQLRKKILALWPDLSQSETDHIKIFVTSFMMFFRLRLWLEHQGTDGTQRVALS